HQPSAPRAVPLQQVAASGRQDGMHDLPSRPRPRHRFPRRRPLARRGRGAGEMEEEPRLAAEGSRDLSDAARPLSRGLLSSLPPGGGSQRGGASLEPREGSHREGGVLRLPQDQGVRGTPKGGTPPYPADLEDDAGVGGEMDRESEGFPAGNLDAPLLR